MNNIGYVICESGITSKEATIIGENNNRVTVEVILQDMNVKNRNGRFYSDNDLKPELTSARMKELIESKNMFGEAGHPMSKDLARQQTIDPNNVSHLITKLWTEGNDIKAYVRGSQNNKGEYFNNFILDGTKPSFSLRALGTVQNTARGAEVKNIRIITWDWVIYPSHKRAYTQNIVQNMKESGILTESSNLVMEQTDSGLLIPITNDKVINCIKNNSNNLNSMMESFDNLYDSIVLVENGNKVQLSSKDGNVYVINLEAHIQNKIRQFCFDRF